MITYTPLLLDTFGGRLATIPDYVALKYVLNSTPGGIGALELTVKPSFDLNLFLVDGRIVPLRSVAGRAPMPDRDAVFLIRRLRINADDTATVTCLHATSLLKRRHILYYAGSTFATKTGPADDLIKTFAYQNLLSGVNGASRIGDDTLADVSAVVSLQANASAAPGVTKAAAWRNLLDVCTELAEASAAAGTYLTFGITNPSESTLELRTWTTARGIDHRASSGDPRILSRARGNVEQVIVDEDHTEEKTFAVAGGVGENDARRTGSYLDTTRVYTSPFGRIETFADTSNIYDQTTLTTEASGAVRAARPVLVATANLIQTPAMTRGIHIDLGDLVTLEHRGRAYDARLDVVQVEVAAGKATETIGVRSV